MLTGKGSSLYWLLVQTSLWCVSATLLQSHSSISSLSLTQIWQSHSKWCFRLIGASPNDLSPNDLPVQMILQSKWSQSKWFKSKWSTSPNDLSVQMISVQMISVQMIFQSKWSTSPNDISPNDPSPIDPSPINPSLNDSGPSSFKYVNPVDLENIESTSYLC